MRIGAEDLLKKYKTGIRVAEALIMGRLRSYQEDFASEAIGGTFVFEAAKTRIELGLTKPFEDDE